MELNPWVNSGADSLDKVIVHTPDKNSRYIDKRPEEYLFSQKPDWNKLVSEHENFVQTLENLGVETVEIENILSNNNARNRELPNLLFTRDLAAVIGDNIVLSSMETEVRQAEEKLFKDSVKNNQWKLQNTIVPSKSIEGGDIFLLNKDTVLAGNSLRTSEKAIESISKQLIQNNTVDRVISLDVPRDSTSIHLDMVFNQLDHRTFLCDEKLSTKNKGLKLFETDGKNVSETFVGKDIGDGLSRILGKEIEVLEISNSSEQESCGFNVLPVNPKELISYESNTEINEIIEEQGFELHKVKGEELVKGRGGPRCMTLPIKRT